MDLRRLVKLAARAFYDDLTSKGDNQPKTGRSDNRGIAVVVLDALTRFNLPSSLSTFQDTVYRYSNVLLLISDPTHARYDIHNFLTNK